MTLEPYVTHLAVFVLGVATWLPFTLWEGRRVTKHKEPLAVDAELEQNPPRRHRPWPLLVTVLLVGGALLIGFGLQQAHYQGQAEARAACVEDWGRGVTDTIATRTDATAQLDAARNARDDALDNIVLVIISIRAEKAPDRALSPVLSEFARARARLERALRDAQTTRADNPYPGLRCD